MTMCSAFPAGTCALDFGDGPKQLSRMAKTGKDLTLRAALNNVTNKRYWGFQYENYIQPADPRSVSLTAKIAY